MFNFMPKDPTFNDQLEKLTDAMVNAVQQLASKIGHWSSAQGLAASLERERHNAHIQTRLVLRRLDNAFITPFDREDILQLAEDLYRVIASVANAADRMDVFGLTEVHPSLHGQCTTLNAIARQVNSAVKQLRTNAGLGPMRRELDEIGRLEEQSRQDRTKFLTELYSGSPDPLDVMKKREIQDLLVAAIEACDDVGRTIEQVLLKND